jgi:hypothetical protein
MQDYIEVGATCFLMSPFSDFIFVEQKAISLAIHKRVNKRGLFIRFQVLTMGIFALSEAYDATFFKVYVSILDSIFKP